MKTKHYLICEAPICQGDINPHYKNEVIWYPGEKVCQKKPYQKFQRKQIDINKWVKNGTFKNIDQAYTAHDLETKLI
jgi:hypothetical protein